jgi:hypothetical protein
VPIDRGHSDVPRRHGLAAGFDGVGYPAQNPDEVAALVLFLASPVSRPVNGAHLLSDFGMGEKFEFLMD